MKISHNWLKQFLPAETPAGNYRNISAVEAAQYLTHCGLEVENIGEFRTVKGGLKGLVIGEVKSKAQHPNADGLWLRTVDNGTGAVLNIVCGASNVAVGQNEVIAAIGA